MLLIQSKTQPKHVTGSSLGAAAKGWGHLWDYCLKKDEDISESCLRMETGKQKPYLGQTDRTEPVSFWNSLHLGPMTVNVTASVTSITKQEKLIIVTLPADQAGLDQREKAE